MPFHLNVPRPNPDELFYSVVGRFAHHHGLQGAKPVSEALFGMASVVVPTLLPARLDRLRWLIERRWRTTLEDIALDHTLLPYYLSTGGPATARKAALVEGVGEDRSSHLEQALGIAASRIATPDRLRYCAACAREDRERTGEAYWHRVHQLPGVYVCPDHGIPLSVSKVPLVPVARSAAVAAELAIGTDEDPVERLSDTAQPVAWQIARYCQKGLSLPRPDQVGLRELQAQLEIAGFGRERGKLQELHEQFETFVGTEVLRRIEPDWRPGRTLSWVMQIRRKPRKALHPTRFHLMRLFLDSLHVPSRPAPFGSGPWSCPNWLADHFGQPVVEDLSVVTDRRHPDRVIGRFRCSCGMVFTRFAQEETARRSIRIREFGPLFKQRAAELNGQGSSIRAIAQALKVHWKTAKRLVDVPAEAEATTPDQSRWRQLMADHPSKGVKFLREFEPALYARLYRRDPEWLKRNSPRAERAKSAAKRVDWAARDLQWAEAVGMEAERLLAEEPRQRITRTALVRRLGYQATVEKRLELLPETAAMLARVCETAEQFRARRLRQVANETRDDLPLWMLTRKAGLRPELITADVLRMAQLAHLAGG